MTADRTRVRDNQGVKIGKAPAGIQISCAVCLNQRGDRIPAVTLIRGYAVCHQHTDLVSQPEFDIFTLHGARVRPV